MFNLTLTACGPIYTTDTMKNNYYWPKLGHLEDIRNIIYAIHNDKKNLEYNFQSMTNCALVKDNITKLIQNVT